MKVSVTTLFAMLLMVGIAVGDTQAERFESIFLILPFISVACLLLLFFISRLRVSTSASWLFSISISIATLSLGLILGSTSRKRTEATWPQRAQAYLVKVDELPITSKNGTRIDAIITHGTNIGKKVRLHIPDSITPHVGNRLIVWCQIGQPSNLGYPGAFDYAGYLRHHGFSGTGYVSKWEYMPHQEPSSFSELTQVWREELAGKLREHLSGQPLDILLAMSLGDKRSLDAETRNAFSDTGTAHILALSGLHLAILFSILNVLLLPFAHHSWTRIVGTMLIIAFLWLYALIVGMPVSLCRAAIMLTIVQCSILARRTPFTLNNLSIAAIIILIWWPQMLFDIGFQLSFASVASIAIMSNRFPIPQKLWRFRTFRMMSNLLAISLWASLGTYPLVAYYFHKVPTYGLLTNLVVVPLGYAILFAAILFFAISPFRPLIAEFLRFIVKKLYALLDMVGSWPAATLDWHPSALMVVGYYLVMLSLIAQFKHKWGKTAAIASALAFLTLTVFADFNRKSISGNIYVYKTYDGIALHAFQNRANSYVINIDSCKLAPISEAFWKVEKIADPQTIQNGYSNSILYFGKNILAFGHKRIAIINELYRNSDKNAELTLETDVLIVGKHFRGNVENAGKKFKPKVIVLSNKLSKRKAAEWSIFAKSLHIDLRDLRKEESFKIHAN